MLREAVQNTASPDRSRPDVKASQDIQSILNMGRNPIPPRKTRLKIFAFLAASAAAGITIPAVHGQDAGESAPPPPPATKDPAPEPPAEQYYVANAAYNRGLYPVAVTQFEEFLTNHPEHSKAPLARRGLALSLYAQKQYEEAMPHFAALLAAEELDEAISRERLIMLQGQCLLRTGRKDEAKKLFGSEIDNLQSVSYRASAEAAMCDLSFGQGAWAEVITWSARLLAGEPDAGQAARALYQQGYAHYQSAAPDAAIKSLLKIGPLEAGPAWGTRASYLLGECYSLQQKYEQAEAAFEAALPGLEGPEAAECQYRLGLTRFVLGKYEDARQDLEAYLKASADGAHAKNANLYVARCHLEDGEHDAAAELLEPLCTGEDAIAARANLWLARAATSRTPPDYSKAVEILRKAATDFSESPVSAELRFDLANALMGTPKPDWVAALALLDELREIQTFPHKAEIIAQRAICLHKLEKFEESLAANQRFLASHSGHDLAGDARFMQAENLFLLDRLDEAAKAYKEYLATDSDHPNRTAATFRVAQIAHDQRRWDDCLAAAAPLLESKPKGRLYAPLPMMIGDCYFRQEKWSEALPPLREFVSRHVTAGEDGKPAVTAAPNLDTALAQIAVAYDRTGKPEQALKHLNTLVNHYERPTPQLPLALAEQGRLAYQAGNLKLARKALERFLELDAENQEPFSKHAPAQRARVHYYLGWVDAAQDKHESAAQHFGQVVKLGDHPNLAPDAALQQGIAWVNSGNYEAAAKHFPEVLKRYPEHDKLARLVYYSGLALARQKQWTEAASYFKRITESFPESQFADQALYERAWCERAANRKPEAAKLYEQLLANHPDSPLVVKVQSELAELNLESGNQDMVIKRLTEALEKAAGKSLREEMRYQLANAHFRKGDFETAAGQFEELIEDYPESKLLASMLFQAGESRFKLKETEPACEHFAAASKVPGSAEPLAESITMRLAETLALTGRHDEAAETYQTFLDRFEKSRWRRNARFGLAFAMENGGNSESALAEYKKLLDEKKIDLWTVRARFQTGECYFNLKQYDKAITEFVGLEVAYKQYPAWQAKAVLEIGRVLLAQDKPEQAAQRFKDVIQRYAKQKAAVVAKQYLDELRSR